MNCSFIIHVDEVVGLEVPIHKWWQFVTNFDDLIVFHKFWCC